MEVFHGFLLLSFVLRAALVRMVTQGHLLVSFFDILLGCLGRHTKNIVQKRVAFLLVRLTLRFAAGLGLLRRVVNCLIYFAFAFFLDELIFAFFERVVLVVAADVITIV